MDFPSKKFIIFFLIASVVGVSALHWFFVAEMMPANECFSINCVYSSPQAIPQEVRSILLIISMAIILAVIMPSTISSDNKPRRISGRMFLEWKIDGFCHKFISWLKTLEKRDPEAALTAARISDFRQ